MIFETRPGDSVDEPLVRSAWIASALSGYAYRGMPRGKAESSLRECIDQALERSVTLVVADKARPEHAIGWSVSEHVDDDTTIVHYVYVKQAWRRKGVGSALARAMGLLDTKRVTYSHANTTSVRIGPQRGWQYDPFTLWRPNP